MGLHRRFNAQTIVSLMLETISMPPDAQRLLTKSSKKKLKHEGQNGRPNNIFAPVFPTMHFASLIPF